MLKISALALAAAAAVAVPTLIPASPAVSDFSTLPPDPFQMEQTPAAATVDAAGAAKLAADKVNGSVSSVVASTTPEGVRYAVTAYSDGKRHDMVIAADGKVMMDNVVPRFPGDAVGDAVGWAEAVGNAVKPWARDAVGDAVGAAVGDAVGAAVGAAFHCSCSGPYVGGQLSSPHLFPPTHHPARRGWGRSPGAQVRSLHLE